MNNTTLAGLLQSVKEISGPDANVKVFDLTIGVKNKYKNKEGEHAGKYGREFISTKFYARSPEQAKFVNETLTKVVEEKGNIAVVAELRNESYEKNGEKVYRLVPIVQDITPFI